MILSANDPPEEVRALISSPLYDNKVTYILGSALNIDDLKRVRCDTATCMFFLADMQVYICISVYVCMYDCIYIYECVACMFLYI